MKSPYSLVVFFLSAFPVCGCNGNNDSRVVESRRIGDGIIAAIGKYRESKGAYPNDLGACQGLRAIDGTEKRQ